jgi:sRNA-binding protein
MMQERYPQIFSWGRPLAIGIDKALREAFSEEELPTADLGVFLRVWVRRKAYRAALERGERRVNLDGSDAGPAFGDLPEAPPKPAPNVSAGADR